MLHLNEWRVWLRQRIWEDNLRTQPFWYRLLLSGARIGAVVARDFADGRLSLLAMSLVYTTLLSIVPVLAVSFSVLKAFGVHNEIEITLLNFLAPLGAQGEEITNTVVSFVENVSIGVLGSLGLLFLVYTVISLLQKIEEAFNEIWQVKSLRPLARRFSDYLSVVLIGPVLIFSALGIKGSLMNSAVFTAISQIEPFGTLIAAGAQLTPYLLVISAFTFIYCFVPNARVHFSSALIGGISAGILWNITGWAFASFVVGSAQYAAIYSALASLVLFMVWIYAGWTILLLGSKVAFYHQHPEYVTLQSKSLLLSIAERERLALHVALMIGQRFAAGAAPWTASDIARHLAVPAESINQILTAFQENKITIETAGEIPSYQPAQPLDRISLAHLIDIVRGADQEGHHGARHTLTNPHIKNLVADMRSARTNALSGQTLKDLVEHEGEIRLVSRESAEESPPAA